MRFMVCLCCFLFLSFQQIDSVQRDTSSTAKMNSVVSGTPLSKLKDDSVWDRDSAMIDNSKIKTCYYLEIGKTLEEQGQLTDAYEAYKEVLDSCPDSAQVNEAYLSIKRLNTYKTQASSYLRNFFTSVLAAFISLPFIAVVVILLIRLIVLRPLTRNKPAVLVNPLKISPSGGDTHEYLTAHIEWYFYRKNEQRKLMREISGLEYDSGAKPIVTSEGLSTSHEMINAIVPEDYWKIVSFILRIVDRPKFIVEGYIDITADDERRIFIRLNKGNKIIKIWQRRVDINKISGQLKNLSYKVVTEIERNLQ